MTWLHVIQSGIYISESIEEEIKHLKISSGNILERERRSLFVPSIKDWWISTQVIFKQFIFLGFSSDTNETNKRMVLAHHLSAETDVNKKNKNKKQSCSIWAWDLNMWLLKNKGRAVTFSSNIWLTFVCWQWTTCTRQSNCFSQVNSKVVPLYSTDYPWR